MPLWHRAVSRGQKISSVQLPKFTVDNYLSACYNKDTWKLWQTNSLFGHKMRFLCKRCLHLSENIVIIALTDEEQFVSSKRVSKAKLLFHFFIKPV